MNLPRVQQVWESPEWHWMQEGMQIYVSRAGEVLVNAAWGWNGESGRLETGHLSLWLSAGKPITAVGVLQCVARGQLDLEAPVAQIVPEFAAGGKDRVTLRHLLTHTGGFRSPDVKEAAMDWESEVARVCGAPLEPRWEPGAKAGYHMAGSWTILGELIRRVDGRHPADYLFEEVLEPSGMKDSRVGFRKGDWERLASRLGWIFDASPQGCRPHPRWNRREECEMCRPGSGARGPAADLGKFYEMLLRGGKGPDGREVLPAYWVAQMTRRQREGMFDHTFRYPLDWGLGVAINSHRDELPQPYGFGARASRSAFGHGGNQAAIGFADPEEQTVVVILWNGRPGEAHHHPRARAFIDALERDLGLFGA